MVLKFCLFVSLIAFRFSHGTSDSPLCIARTYRDCNKVTDLFLLFGHFVDLATCY